MYLRINGILLFAILLGFASAIQSNKQGTQRNDEITFNDDDIEGSGTGSEVNIDLESSGSGSGPDDDEDTPQIGNVPKVIPPTTHTEEPKRIEPTKERTNVHISKEPPSRPSDPDIIMNPKPEDRPTSFFAQPGILAAVIGGAVVGLLCAILVVMFIVYRMRKKDEGSYSLGEPKQSPNANTYNRGSSKEFYA